MMTKLFSPEADEPAHKKLHLDDHDHDIDRAMASTSQSTTNNSSETKSKKKKKRRDSVTRVVFSRRRLISRNTVDAWRRCCG
jgi:hypothetical protein